MILVFLPAFPRFHFSIFSLHFIVEFLIHELQDLLIVHFLDCGYFFPIHLDRQNLTLGIQLGCELCFGAICKRVG